jgi:DNA-binding NarL/FixJ family response regulator
MDQPDPDLGEAAPGNAAAKPRAIIVSDVHLYREGLAASLARDGRLEIAGLVASFDAFPAISAKRPDVVLLDMTMPGVDGIEAARKIHEQNIGAAVIILSGQDDDVALARAIQAGARGYLPKTEAVTGLAEAIRRAHRGEPLHTSAEVEEALRKLRRRRAADGDLSQRIERLTPRELEILQRMANGDAPEQIAEELGMSRHTLRTHTQNVLTKLGVHSKLEAIVAAIRYGKVRTTEVAPEGDLDDDPVVLNDV